MALNYTHLVRGKKPKQQIKPTQYPPPKKNKESKKAHPSSAASKTSPPLLAAGSTGFLYQHEAVMVPLSPLSQQALFLGPPPCCLLPHHKVVEGSPYIFPNLWLFLYQIGESKYKSRL